MQNFEAHPMVSKFRGSDENWPSCASFILCDSGKNRYIMAQTHIGAGKKYQMNKKLNDMYSEAVVTLHRNCISEIHYFFVAPSTCHRRISAKNAPKYVKSRVQNRFKMAKSANK